MRRSVWRSASPHCGPDRRSTRPERTAATKTPVPAAESQLMAKRAASGLAFTGATGGIRCTMLCSAGMSQTGSDSVPANLDPSSVVENVTLENRLFRNVLNAGAPHRAQQATRMIHGIHAEIVWPVV